MTAHRMVVRHVTSPGFNVDFARGVLVPAQSVDFIGMTLDSVAFTVHLSAARVSSVRAYAEKDDRHRYQPIGVGNHLRRRDG